MFGKLKEMTGGSLTDDLVAKYGPEIKNKLHEIISQVDAVTINEDDSYLQKVVPPVRMAVESAASGATKLVAGFNQKFDVAMLHLRDELVVANDYSLELASDFDERLPEVLKTGFEKAKDAELA